MYVTRKLSDLLRFPESLSEHPEGPNSGFLVIQDDKSETYSCFGLWKNRSLMKLPFPQNKELKVRYMGKSGEHQDVICYPVILIPVLNQPLSSNRYYAIDPHGKHKGKAFTCSTEDDKVTCCFCRCICDAKPRPLDPQNVYQQLEVVPYIGFCTPGFYFTSKSIAPDGFPPSFIRVQNWKIYKKTPKYFELDEAKGIDSALRTRLPESNLSLSKKSSVPVLVGKWYCPFAFVKEQMLREQVERSLYYEVTLEQRWEQIFTFQKNMYGNQGNIVVIDTSIEEEEVYIDENKATWNEKDVVDGVIWFKSYSSSGGDVGLRVEVFQRMKWEEERGGWIGSEERQVKVNRVEEFKGNGDWKEFGLYVLVERFNFRRMDGSLAMAFDFKHLDHMQTIWE